MYTSSFLCAFGLLAALQLPGSMADNQVTVNPGVTGKDQQEILDKHNDLRRAVTPTASNMVKMTWNNKAAEIAQKWAKTCPMQHSSYLFRKINATSCGENLFMSSHRLTWSKVIDSWYSEVKDWEFGSGSINDGVVGHFTQVVWYKSHKIGCGLAYCPDSRFKYFYVCHYCPVGNYNLARPYKTGKSCADCPDNCDNGLCTNPCPYNDRFENCPMFKMYCEVFDFVKQYCGGTCKCKTEIV
ncbi:cysteine-rich venom protein TEL1-like [Labrus mixtus]|uniref:cysteine-rich venom protein TEL1-like n=1 Tax=Labrus mixtus TaxID=508554 RepID=UPI0029C0DB0A|nr:cysteine-rich venom protein TEL1-like [Labrus mixtus]